MTSPTQASSPVRDWHAQSVATCVADLGTDAEAGLAPDDIARRREEYGSNELPASQGRSRLRRLGSQFTNPLIVVLLVAGGVTLLLAHYVDAAVIFGVVVINAVIGFVLRLADTRAQRVAILRRGRVEVGHGDSHMVQASDHLSSLPQGPVGAVLGVRRGGVQAARSPQARLRFVREGLP